MKVRMEVTAAFPDGDERFVERVCGLKLIASVGSESF